METRSIDAELTRAADNTMCVPRLDISGGRPPAAVRPRPRALLVDEDGSDRRLLASDLTLQGFDVVCTDDVDNAVGAALRVQPVLVVLELRLRAGAGLDLLARVRPHLPEARFVVLTNYGSVASAVKAMRLGATHVLCKPAAATEVLRAAEQPTDQLAERRAEQRELRHAAADDGDLAPLASLTLDEAIWEYINRTVEDAGSLSEAARRLGIWRQSLKRMISKYRPTPPRLPASAAR